MFTEIQSYLKSLEKDFNQVPEARRMILEKISNYVFQRLSSNNSVNLVYVCTHNSRRSHYGQIWAKVASVYFNIPNINTFSGGTEATAFNIHAINALKKIGFEITPQSVEKNTVYLVKFDNQLTPIECFSKVYNDIKNPQSEFAAIMTCSDAEENCPFIPGVDLRIATTYEDPKAFDGTALQDEKYSERCRQIALETLYVFYKVSQLQKQN